MPKKKGKTALKALLPKPKAVKPVKLKPFRRTVRVGGSQRDFEVRLLALGFSNRESLNAWKAHAEGREVVLVIKP